MSQVDDWSDGYTSDYLRDLNTYGPASANVPRPSSVVSHQVRYRAPDTSDIPLAPGQNPEGSVYSNASGARMGQLKSRSGYNPPAGGGYTAQTFPSSGAGAKRYARPKPAVKKKTQSASKQQTQSASKRQPQPEYRTGGARTPEENEITRSAAEHRAGADLGELSSQALDAAVRFLPALKLLGFGAGAGSADTASTDIQQDDLDRAYNWTATGNAGTGGFSPERPMIDSSDAASGIPPEIMARLKKDADDGSPWGLLPWALGPIYKPIAGLLPVGQKLLPAGQKLLPAGQKLLPAGQKLLPYNGEAAAGAVGSKAGEAAAGDAAAGAGGRSFGFDLSAEDVAAANAANAAAKQQAVNLSEMRSTLIRAGMPDREIEAYMHGAGFYNDPEALRQAIDVVRKYGMAGLFEHSAARAGSAAGTGAGSAAGTGSRGSFRFDLSPEEIASAKASHDAYVRGTAGAADGGVSELANAGNVGRETAAGAATGSVSEGVDSASQQLIQHIRSGTLDEMERAWIEATAAGAAKAPGTIDAATQAILNEARAAGILGREAAAGGQAAGREAAAAGEQAAGREAAGAGRAGEAAGGAPATGSVPKRGEPFGDVTWNLDIAARDQAADFVTSGKYGVGPAAGWYRKQLLINDNLDGAAIDREVARFIQQFTGGAKGAAGAARGAAGAARGAPQDSVAELANADKVGSTATRTGGSTNTAGYRRMTETEIRNQRAALSEFRTIPAGLSPLKLVAEIRSVGKKDGFADPARLAAAVHEVYGLSSDEATRLVLLIKDGAAGRGALAPLFRSADAFVATLPK